MSDKLPLSGFPEHFTVYTPRSEMKCFQTVRVRWKIPKINLDHFRPDKLYTICTGAPHFNNQKQKICQKNSLLCSIIKMADGTINI